MKMNGTTCLIAFALAAVAGCASTGSSPGTPVAADHASDLRTATIRYAISDVATRAGVEQVDHEESASQGGMALAIEYPHPEGKKNKALASVVVIPREPMTEKKNRLGRWGQWLNEAMPGLSVDQRVATAKAVTLDKSELDGLLRTLHEEGAFHNSGNTSASLSVEINGASQVYSSRGLPSLAALVARITEKGYVLPATHPHVVNAVADYQEPNDSFYQDLQAGFQEQVTDEP